MAISSLDRLEPLDDARIVRINSDFDVRERLVALGLRPGRRVQIVRRLGARGPIQVRVDHTDFVVRAAEASAIDVEVGA